MMDDDGNITDKEKQNQAKHKSHEAELKEKEHEYDMMHSVADQLNEESVGLLSEQEYNDRMESSMGGDDDGYFAKMERNPCTFCCRAYSCFVVLGFLMGIAASFGATIIRISTEVPMYIREHRTYKAETAVLQAEEIAGAKLDEYGLSLQEREEDEFSLEILYIKRSGGLDDPDVLADMKKLEEKIIFDREYEDFCTLDYTLGDTICGDPDDLEFTEIGCRRHTSALNFFDPAFWLPAYDATDGDSPTVPSLGNLDIFLNSKLAQSGPGSFAFADPADRSVDDTDFSSSNIATVIEYWSRYCHLEASECPPEADTTRSPFAYVEVNETAFICDNTSIPIGNATAANYFWSVVDSGFGLSFTGEPRSTTVRGWRTEIFMGTPRRDGDSLLETEGDDLDEQEDDIGEFLFEFQDDLEDGIGNGVDVYWDGTGMEDLYAEEQLFQSFMWVAGSFLFVLSYLTAQTSSFFLAIAGMVMILLNFIPAILLYRFVFQFEYFGVLNMLGVFIILGIGVDDIFVFLDTWNATEWHFPGQPFRVRIAEALAVAGKAMSVTSSSTALSFFANATSVFPAVYTFGIFCALLVICNFCSVCFVWPRVIAVWQYYVGTGAKLYACYCFPVKSSKNWGYPKADASQPPEPGTVEVFFRDKFYTWIIDGSPAGRKGCGSKVVIALFSIYILVCIIFAAQLEPDPELPELFPDEDNYIKFPDIKAEFFAREDDPRRIYVQIPFGIKDLDQDDCGSPCDPTDPEDYGTIIWDETITEVSSDEYVQKWYLDFCEDMEFSDGSERISASDRKVFVADQFVSRPVRCWWQSFKAWCEENNCPKTREDFALSKEDYIVDAAVAEEKVREFLAAPQPTSDPDYQSGRTNADVWEDYIFAEDVFGTRVLRFFIIEAVLTEQVDFDFEKGIELFEDWEDWLKSWEELAGSSIYDFQDTLQFAFVSDARAFHYFFLQEQIIAEAFQGIALSLFLAWCVMLVASGNWLIATMAIGTIGLMVLGVIAFTVWNGWKLGVIEAVIYVMVVGLSVDYTVHLSDAYLESNEVDRRHRTQDMLFRMGVSVVSGAISTFGAALFLLAPYITFFPKFGSFLAFVVAQSLIFSLFFFSAILHEFGPEHRKYGEDIQVDRKVKMHDELLAYLDDLLDPDNRITVDSIAVVEDVSKKEGYVLLLVYTSKGSWHIKCPLQAVRLRSQSGDIDDLKDCLRFCRRSCSRRKEEISKWYLAKETVVLPDIRDILVLDNPRPPPRALKKPSMQMDEKSAS